jgi:hypothetical protein
VVQKGSSDMVAEWFYTDQGQRRGPVTWQQLQQLATGGQLKPNDLVWKNGMPQWSPASSQAGLFGAPTAPAPAAAAPPAPASAPSRPAAPAPAPAAPAPAPPRTAPSQPAPQPAASRPSAPPASKPNPAPSAPAAKSAPAGAAPGPAAAPPAKTGTGTGFKLAILAGGAAVVFLVLCCGIGGAIWWFTQSGDKSWKLEPTKSETWTLKFKKDENVEVTATAKADGDFGLAVYKNKAAADAIKAGNPSVEPALASTTSSNSKECKLTFPAPETQDYYVVLINLGKETNEGKLTYKSTPK